MNEAGGWEPLTNFRLSVRKAKWCTSLSCFRKRPDLRILAEYSSPEKGEDAELETPPLQQLLGQSQPPYQHAKPHRVSRYLSFSCSNTTTRLQS